jgi:RNA polymerase sigma-70 factor (ECF subfamily)
VQTQSQSTDEQLMQAFAQGNRGAFDQLFERYRQRIYGFFRRRVPEVARAEELTQETFVAILHATGRYEPRAAFRAYLFAIAFRILKAERRKLALRAFFFAPSSVTVASPRAESTEEALWLKQGLSRLARRDREILMLREFEQLSYGEIAKLLDLKINTVRSRLFRARSALRENLEGLKENQVGSLVEKGDGA